jgi:type IV secretory pathway VirB4 component
LEYQGDISDRNIVTDKTDIVLSIAETCKRQPLTPKERNTLDRALKFAFTEAELHNRQTTLTDLYNSLSRIESYEAKDLMEYLELFVNGSFNIFAKESNVDAGDNRLMMFGLKDMGTELRDLTMIIMLECVKEKILSNAKKGICTWLYIDEFHEILHTEYQQTFIKKLWMLVRSLGGICTGLTQNVADICLNYTTKAMLENSEFLVIMKQKEGAVELIKDELGLSDELIKYVTRESASGRGLLRSGSVTVPFDITINDDSRLFSLGVLEKDFHTLNS